MFVLLLIKATINFEVNHMQKGILQEFYKQVNFSLSWSHCLA